MRAGKRRANTVLAAAVVLFIAALVLKSWYPDNKLAAAFLTITEAGVAGGVADWFAVTALFRRPLGFSYHTAIIPRNRQRVIAALAQAVEQDFLNKQALTARLSQVRFTDKVIAYLQAKPVRPAIRAVIDKTVTGLAAAVDPQTLGRYAERVLKLVLRRQPLARQVAGGINWALRESREQALYLAIVEELSVVARRESTREFILTYLQQIKEKTAGKNWLTALITGFMEMTDAINLEDAAEALHRELCKTVAELKEEEHPVRVWFQTELSRLAGELVTPAWEQAVDNWKEGLLQRFALAEPLGVLIETALQALTQPSAYRENMLEWLTDQLEAWWQQFLENTRLQDQAEVYFKTVLLTLVAEQHQLIGQIASQALNKLSDEDLNRFIEDKAGEDLDWIRINGVIVGSVAGAGLAAIRILWQ